MIKKEVPAVIRKTHCNFLPFHPTALESASVVDAPHVFNLRYVALISKI
jgi:hypothetical protein